MQSMPRRTCVFWKGGFMKRVFLGTIYIACVILIASSTHAFEVGVRGYYWFPVLKGDISVEGNGVSGTDLDLDDDLGVGDEFYPIVEAFLGLGDHHVSLSYYHADYSGTKDLTKAITFNGKAFAQNQRVSTSLEHDVSDLMYQYDLLDLENILAGFSLGIVGRVKLIDGRIQVKSGTQDEKEDFTEAIPMLGANLHIGILADIVEARVLATGIRYGDGTVFDGLAEISYTPFPFLDIHGGYRAFFIDLDVDDVDLNYNTSGPYVALTVGF